MASVLFVDDEAAIRKAVRAWLTRKGHVVHEADSVDAARRVILDQRLDGIFIDLWIGRESGIELLAWLEDLDPELSRRVTFITGDLFATTTAAPRFGHPVITKPFQLADLEEHVTEWVRARAGRGERQAAERDDRPPGGDDAAQRRS